MFFKIIGKLPIIFGGLSPPGPFLKLRLWTYAVYWFWLLVEKFVQMSHRCGCAFKMILPTSFLDSKRSAKNVLVLHQNIKYIFVVSVYTISSRKNFWIFYIKRVSGSTSNAIGTYKGSCFKIFHSEIVTRKIDKIDFVFLM